MQKLNIIKSSGLAMAVAIVLFGLNACTKDNEFIKEELEKALPHIEVTSLGLLNQYGPFSSANTIQATFGGSTTQTQLQTVDYAWYSGGNQPQLVDSVHFPQVNVAASAATGNSSLSTQFLDTTYPNTQVFTGKINLPLRNLAPGSYTLRVYVRSSEGENSMVSVSNFITIR